MCFTIITAYARPSEFLGKTFKPCEVNSDRLQLLVPVVLPFSYVAFLNTAHDPMARRITRQDLEDNLTEGDG